MTDGAPPPGPAEPDELAGRLQAALGDGYRVEGRLGAGGFAVVYRVQDLELRRQLAVKVLSPDVITSHAVLERFRREAQTVAQLSHPNIVTLHFIGQKEDLVYLVMELVDGGSLADRLQREKDLPIPEATRILAEVADALAHAHRRGVVHRDIKPQNVLIDSESGRALVTDFGIARTADGGPLTLTGLVVGTPAYLSPEQLAGEPADHRADIYALGVMAYEMIAGEPPFTGAPSAALARRLAGPPEPLSARRPRVPAELEQLVASCLEPDPAARPGDADGIVRALTNKSSASGDEATTASARSTRNRGSGRWRWYALAAGAVIGVGTVTAALATRDRPAPPAADGVPTVVPELVLIAGGTYVIGSDSGPPAARPAHTVRLAPFGIGRYEITVGEYERYVRERGLSAPWGTKPDDRMPVTGVTYSEALSFCAWRHPKGGRLPTEHEWEAAARGRAGRLYPWGERWNAAAANVGNLRDGPAPVGTYPLGRTPDGVYDLIGNVWEWTSSEFRPYGDSAARPSRLYVIRGGGYNSLLAVSNAVFRGQAQPVTERANLAATGFRCAMDARTGS